MTKNLPANEDKELIEILEGLWLAAIYGNKTDKAPIPKAAQSLIAWRNRYCLEAIIGKDEPVQETSSNPRLSLIPFYHNELRASQRGKL